MSARRRRLRMPPETHDVYADFHADASPDCESLRVVTLYPDCGCPGLTCDLCGLGAHLHGARCPLAAREMGGAA